MLERISVLAVDDESQNIRIFQDIFGEEYCLKTAESAEEALKMLPEFRPDVVLLDIMMPGIDGYELCRRIRENAQLRFTKTIMVSAKTMIEEKLMGYDFGANDYVAKPFNDEELLAKVKSMAQLKYAQEIDEMKNNLMKFFSHELRTPLNAMVGFSGLLLQSGSLNEHERSYMEHVLRAAQALINLSDKAALYHKLKTDIQIVKKLCSVDLLISQTVLDWDQKAQQTGVSVSCSTGFAGKFMMDPDLISKALWYMLENAIRLSPQGSDVSVLSSQVNRQCCIHFQNEKARINESELQRLLDEIPSVNMLHYQQGQAFSLWMARVIAQWHGGDLNLCSLNGKGFQFSFFINLADNHGAESKGA